MGNDSALILAVVVFLAIITSFSLVSDVWRDFTAAIGSPTGIPFEVTFLVLLGAIAAAVVVLDRF